jgi:hypothetical protein
MTVARRFIAGSVTPWPSSRRDSMIVARHEVPGVMKKNAPSQRDGDSLHRYPRHLYVFSATSQSCSSFVLVRFSGDPNEPSAACFLRSSLFHPGNRPTEDEDDWPAKHVQALRAWLRSPEH